MSALILDVGWHEDVSMEDYLRVPALSSSGELVFDRSAAHFKEELDNPSDPTVRMKMGTALHAALLEPDLFATQYVGLEPCQAELKSGKRKGEPCGNAGKVYRDGASYCGTHDPEPDAPDEGGIIAMPSQTMDSIEGMKNAVLSHPDASGFFRGKGASELTGIARDPGTGVLLKIRLDRSLDRAEWIHTDLKMCPDASQEAFTKHAGRMGYVRKAAFYRHVLALLDREVRASSLVAVEDQRPHGCQVFLLDEGDIAGFRRDIEANVRRYAECLKTGVWPAYESGLRELKLKPWNEPTTDEDEGADWAA